MVQVITLLDHPYTLKKGTHLANFSILTPKQTKKFRQITPVNPLSVQHRLNDNHDDAIHYINSLLKTDEINDIYWLLTAQSSSNEREHTPVQARIFNELRELMKSEQSNPQDNMNSRTQF